MRLRVITSIYAASGYVSGKYNLHVRVGGKLARRCCCASALWMLTEYDITKTDACCQQGVCLCQEVRVGTTSVPCKCSWMDVSPSAWSKFNFLFLALACAFVGVLLGDGCRFHGARRSFSVFMPYLRVFLSHIVSRAPRMTSGGAFKPLSAREWVSCVGTMVI